MKNVNFIKIIAVLMCVATVLGAFTACSSKKTTPNTVKASVNDGPLTDPKWVVVPSIDAQAIEPLVRADYNESTRHYDISYADCFKIKQNGKYGIIDYNGKIVIKPKYDSIVAIRNSSDFVATGKDSDGETVQTYINYNDFSVESSYRKYNTLRYEYLWNATDNSAVFVQNDNGEIYKDDLKAALPESVRGVKDVDGEYVGDGTYGLYINGKNIMGMIYSGAGCFSNGMAAFKSNGVWGYIDSNGKTVLPFGYDAVKGYSAFGGEDTPYESYDGYVTVTKDGKFGVFTNEGKAVTDMSYEGATPVVGGRAYILKDGKWGLASFGDSSDATARTDATTVTKPEETTTEKPTEKTTEKTTVEETTTAEGAGNYVVNTDGLKLRTDAGTQNDIILELSEGTVLTIDRVSDGWGHTYYDGNEGWVSLDYVDKE
ncbi:MAG TPA: WG repeat-containing protein [Oscillospiraceae bacterium]|nr:WG repeat-containing protein [Oscillospiraceae bacterium]